MNNFAQLQLLPVMEFSFDILSHQFLIAFLLKCLTYLLKKTTQRTKIISTVWNKVLKIWDTFFELTQKKYNTAEISSNFFYHKLELLEITWKRTSKAMPKIEKNMHILYIYWECLLCQQSNASGIFLQLCINF